MKATKLCCVFNVLLPHFILKKIIVLKDEKNKQYRDHAVFNETSLVIFDLFDFILPQSNILRKSSTTMWQISLIYLYFQMFPYYNSTIHKCYAIIWLTLKIITIHTMYARYSKSEFENSFFSEIIQYMNLIITEKKTNFQDVSVSRQNFRHI